MGYIPKSFHEIRRDVRFPTDFRTVLRWGENFVVAEVADIADNGMRLIGEHLPELGAVVQINAKGLDERGRVMWRTPHSCGIRLFHRISALGVVRANCFPARRPDKRPLDTVPKAMRAQALAEIAPDDEGMIAWPASERLYRATQTSGTARPRSH